MKEPYPQALIAVQQSHLLKGEVGLFALRSLPTGTLIAAADHFDESVLISWSTFRRLDSVTQKRLRMFCWQSPEGIHAPQNINLLTIPWHINHSCDPNVYMDAQGNYRTLRRIERGSELLIDFATIMTDPHFRLHCRCGSDGCTGTVRPRSVVEKRAKRKP